VSPHDNGQKDRQFTERDIKGFGSVKLVNAVHQRVHEEDSWTEQRPFVLERWRTEPQPIVQPQFTPPRQALVAKLPTAIKLLCCPCCTPLVDLLEEILRLIERKGS
jgi:hypothetical protein